MKAPWNVQDARPSQLVGDPVETTAPAAPTTQAPSSTASATTQAPNSTAPPTTPATAPSGDPAPGTTQAPQPTGTPEPTPDAGSTPAQDPSQTAEPSPTRPPREDDGTTGHRDYDSQADFSSHQMNQRGAATDHLEDPDYEIALDLSSRDFRFPDGFEVEMWVFHREGVRGFPGPTIRVKEGDVFHATLQPSMGPHTIHWHGMEPDPRNDGVGHTSFEVEDSYTYQWKPELGDAGDVNCGTAGTYFYHCHVNTPLHAQMGLLGPMIIDPVELPGYEVTSPRNRRAFADGPEYDIATESLIMPYSLDPRWHNLDHAAGLSGEDVGLNRFEPKRFYITGGLLNSRVERDDVVWAPTQLPINVESNGKAPSLMRLLDGNYLPNKVKFIGPDGNYAKIAEIISHDGRPYRHSEVPGGDAVATCMHENPECRLMTHVVALGAAERYDLLLRPPTAGTYTLRMEWQHWITGALLATRELKLYAS